MLVWARRWGEVMTPTNLLRELTAAGLAPARSLRLAIFGRIILLTVHPWSVRAFRVQPKTDPLVEVGTIAALAAQCAAPTVADGPNLHTVKALGGEPDATPWGFLAPTTARRRAARAEEIGHGDMLHIVGEGVAYFTTTVVRHHLAPTAQTAADVERAGIRLAAHILAIVRRVKP